MEELVEQLKVSLADTFAFYLKAHYFHWNVEGPGFPQYHSLFETIYTDAWEAVDAIAEHIRTLNAYAPGSLCRFNDLKTTECETTIPTAVNMITKLQDDNKKVIDTLTKACVLADKNKKVGLANFLQERIDKHEKHGWMLRATAKA